MASTIMLTASWHVLTPARSSGAEGSTKALPLPSRRARSIGSALNAAKFVVSVLAASPAPASAALPLLVSGVGAGGGVGSAALESRRERRAVAVVVDVRESDGDPYFFAVTVDGDVGEGGDGDGGTTAGLFVLSEETVVGPVDVVRF